MIIMFEYFYIRCYLMTLVTNLALTPRNVSFETDHVDNYGWLLAEEIVKCQNKHGFYCTR